MITGIKDRLFTKMWSKKKKKKGPGQNERIHKSRTASKKGIYLMILEGHFISSFYKFRQLLFSVGSIKNIMKSIWN